MKNYYRVILGRKHVFADEAYKGNFIGADFIAKEDLTNLQVGTQRDFNEKFVPLYFKKHPDKEKAVAVIAGGMMWAIFKGMQIGDVVLCPSGKGDYYVGEVTGSYEFHVGASLPHQRPVRWFPKTIMRDGLSEPLKNVLGVPRTLISLSKYTVEIETLLTSNQFPSIVATDSSIEDPSTFALEEHLEEFLIKNWKSTELGKLYDIYEVDGEEVGRQFQSDTGPIDILARSKDKKEFVVIELKRGRASDRVVGQIQRYMGYVKDELAEDNQTVRGIIIAFEDDIKIKRALSVTSNIDFYSYKIQFKLEKQ